MLLALEGLLLPLEHLHLGLGLIDYFQQTLAFRPRFQLPDFPYAKLSHSEHQPVHIIECIQQPILRQEKMLELLIIQLPLGAYTLFALGLRFPHLSLATAEEYAHHEYLVHLLIRLQVLYLSDEYLYGLGIVPITAQLRLFLPNLLQYQPTTPPPLQPRPPYLTTLLLTPTILLYML